MKTIKIKDWNEVPNNFTGIVKDTNGDKFWYLDGNVHREGGPAIEWSNGNKSWYFNGRKHRIDGPALEYHNGYKAYYINGKEVLKEAQEVLYGFYKLKGIL